MLLFLSLLFCKNRSNSPMFLIASHAYNTTIASYSESRSAKKTSSSKLHILFSCSQKTISHALCLRLPPSSGCSVNIVDISDAALIQCTQSSFRRQMCQLGNMDSFHQLFRCSKITTKTNSCLRHPLLPEQKVGTEHPSRKLACKAHFLRAMSILTTRVLSCG
jgi:hypothetical protein